jgi:hypothetical protein
MARSASAASINSGYRAAALLAALDLLIRLECGIVCRQFRPAEVLALLRLLDGLVPKIQVLHLILDSSEI